MITVADVNAMEMYLSWGVPYVPYSEEKEVPLHVYEEWDRMPSDHEFLWALILLEAYHANITA